MADNRLRYCGHCVDSQGRPKTKYFSETHAISAALKSSLRRGVSLRYYPCPYKNGWHLTSKVERDAADVYREPPSELDRP